MNNLKKVGLTALAGALVSVSANAADLSVTGGVSLNFAGEEKQTTGNGWSMNDGITFKATGELDNGWNVTATQIIDSSDGASGVIMDTRILAIDMGDSGTLTFSGTGGSSVLAAIDDVTPTAGEESWDDVTGASAIPGGTGGDNMFHYSNSSLMDGMTISASYTPSNAATEVESSSDYGIKYTGVDGLTIGLAQGTDETDPTATLDLSNMYVTYAMDAFTVGYQASESDSEATNADKDFTALGLSYAVSEEMSVSVNTSTVDYENATLSDQEATGVSVSYVMGSMTLKANHNSVDNIAGTSTDDRSGYALGLTFAF
ncbi:porin [Candidatus Pelagibacter bacterium nBUS_27]|uniref:porin n=1 Tax=Candidatus Pelagibacter bacterium nBUS_27 TaxID=3374188 RepID=UPI003EBE97B9